MPVRVLDAGLLAPVIAVRDSVTPCRSCRMRELCLPFAFTDDQVRQFDALVTHRTRLSKNDTLYRAGEPFHALYAIQFGSLKTVMLAEDGREQVMGYHMLGEMIGFDGLGTDRHGAAAVALEDTEACALPFGSIQRLARTIPALQHHLHQMMATEIARGHGAMLMLGSMHAEERVAVFLLNLAERYRQRGYSGTEYVLRMTRQEIGSYLGLKLETVSRQFSRFQGDGLIQVQGRALKLLDPGALKRIAGQHV
jgi:CRP/FNR family transcriptional regulator